MLYCRRRGGDGGGRWIWILMMMKKGKRCPCDMIVISNKFKWASSSSSWSSFSVSGPVANVNHAWMRSILLIVTLQQNHNHTLSNIQCSSSPATNVYNHNNKKRDLHAWQLLSRTNLSWYDDTYTLKTTGKKHQGKKEEKRPCHHHP